MSNTLVNLKSFLKVLALPLILSSTYSFLAWSITGAPFASLLFVNTITFLLFFSTLRLFKTKKSAYLFGAFFFLKLILLVLNAHFKLPFLAGIDWFNYNLFALQAIEKSSSFLDLWSNSIDLFVYFCAVIYSIFGSNVEQLYFYVFPFSLILIRYIYKTVLLISNKQKYAENAALLMLFWPVDIIFSVALLREIPIQVLVIISFYNFIKYIKGNSKKALILAFGFALIASLMHSGMVGLIVAYMYAVIQRKFFPEVRLLRKRALLFAIPVLFILIFTPLGGPISNRFSSIGTPEGLLSAFQDQEKFLGDATTDYVGAAPTSIGELIIQAPYRFIMFAMTPFAWQVRDISTALSFLIDGLLQLAFVYICIVLYRNRKKLTPLYRSIYVIGVMCIFFTYLIFSLGTTNYGTAMRHRAKVAPVAVVIVSIYFIEKHRLKNERKL